LAIFKKKEQISREITSEEQKYPNFFVRKKSNVSPKNHWTDCWIIWEVMMAKVIKDFPITDFI
jgi:hypothetical protein